MLLMLAFAGMHMWLVTTGWDDLEVQRALIGLGCFHLQNWAGGWRGEWSAAVGSLTACGYKVAHGGSFKVAIVFLCCSWPGYAIYWHAVHANKMRWLGQSESMQSPFCMLLDWMFVGFGSDQWWHRVGQWVHGCGLVYFGAGAAASPINNPLQSLLLLCVALPVRCMCAWHHCI